MADGRRLARIAYRDPEHVAERLTLFGSQHLGDPSLEWAAASDRSGRTLPVA